MTSSIIYIVGMPASGKTSFGRKLAKALEFDFIDLDQYIEDKEQSSISELFSKYGEDKFREIESKYLKSLTGISSTVISTGGGTPAFYDNMKWMNERGISIYIEENLDSLLIRNFELKTQRPLFQGLSKSELASKLYYLLESREAFYLQTHVKISQNQKILSTKITDNQLITVIKKII